MISAAFIETGGRLRRTSRGYQGSQHGVCSGGQETFQHSRKDGHLVFFSYLHIWPGASVHPYSHMHKDENVKNQGMLLLNSKERKEEIFL